MKAEPPTTISCALPLARLQPVAEITCLKPRDYYLFPACFSLWSFVRVAWPALMAQVEEEIPVEKLSRSSTGIAATQKYDAAQIDKLEGLEADRKRHEMVIGDSDERGLHQWIYEVVDYNSDDA